VECPAVDDTARKKSVTREGEREISIPQLLEFHAKRVELSLRCFEWVSWESKGQSDAGDNLGDHSLSSSDPLPSLSDAGASQREAE
jgi:hypothetical protein